MQVSKTLTLRISAVVLMTIILMSLIFSYLVSRPAQGEQIINPQQELVLKSVKGLLSGQEQKAGAVSTQLNQKVLEGDYKAVSLTNEQLDASVYEYQSINAQLELYLIDLVVTRDTGWQWIQFEALWNPEEEKLIDLKYQPIDYLTRLNSQAASTDGLDVAQQILKRLANPDPALMGWRYKKTESPGQDDISNVQIISVLPFGSHLPPGGKEPTEVAVKAQYQVSMYDYKNLVDSILYLKNYDGHWQLEDIRLLDVKRVSSP